MTSTKESKQQRYVNSVIERIKKDTAMAVALKRADNPSLEYRAWEYFADYKVNLENTKERIPYATVSASLAREKPLVDGFLNLGHAISKTGKDSSPSDQERARLRRILACDTVEEVCTILRPLLSLINARGIKISYGQLLNDLCWFENNPQRTKAHWAQSFFQNVEESE